MTLEMLAYSLALFGALFVIGTLLCLKLYGWDRARFFRSSLWTKVLYWIPIFLVFIGLLYIQFWAAVFVTAVVTGFALYERCRLRKKSPAAWAYTLFICLSFAHLILFFGNSHGSSNVNVLLVVGFSSVLSDVFAYFFGNFLGRHKLPEWINPGKSWEGVAGQLVGALVGFVLILPVIHPALSIALAMVVGIASALGDILNSVVKRRLAIKDWGNTIPGHGGVLDRFASLGLAVAAAYWLTSIS